MAIFCHRAFSTNKTRRKSTNSSPSNPPNDFHRTPTGAFGPPNERVPDVTERGRFRVCSGNHDDGQRLPPPRLVTHSWSHLQTARVRVRVRVPMLASARPRRHKRGGKPSQTSHQQCRSFFTIRLTAPTKSIVSTPQPKRHRLRLSAQVCASLQRRRHTGKESRRQRKNKNKKESSSTSGQ